MVTKTTNRLLTETELEMMHVIWSLGQATAGEVQKALAPERELAYTSVSTILRILEQKEVLRAEKQGRGHVYVPLLKRTDYETRSVNHLVENVFEGNKSAVIKHMIQEKGLTRQDLLELQQLLEQRINK